MNWTSGSTQLSNSIKLNKSDIRSLYLVPRVQGDIKKLKADSFKSVYTNYNYFWLQYNGVSFPSKPLETPEEFYFEARRAWNQINNTNALGMSYMQYLKQNFHL